MRRSFLALLLGAALPVCACGGSGESAEDIVEFVDLARSNCGPSLPYGISEAIAMGDVDAIVSGKLTELVAVVEGSGIAVSFHFTSFEVESVLFPSEGDRALPAEITVSIGFCIRANADRFRAAIPDARVLLVLHEERQGFVAQGRNGLPDGPLFLHRWDGIWFELPDGDFVGFERPRSNIEAAFGRPLSSFDDLVAALEETIAVAAGTP